MSVCCIGILATNLPCALSLQDFDLRSQSASDIGLPDAFAGAHDYVPVPSLTFLLCGFLVSLSAHQIALSFLLSLYELGLDAVWECFV